MEKDPWEGLINDVMRLNESLGPRLEYLTGGIRRT